MLKASTLCDSNLEGGTVEYRAERAKFVVAAVFTKD
jgi:hypothetical protein